MYMIFLFQLEMFYLNTIEQLFLFVEQLDQFSEVCLPYSRLKTGIPIMVVFQNLNSNWNSNKTSLWIGYGHINTNGQRA